MKKLTTIIFCFATLGYAYSQTEFAPVGARWWIKIEYGFNGESAIDSLRCTGTLDTLGHVCKVVKGKHLFSNDTYQLFYQVGATVFVHDPILQDFKLLFDYSKQPGEQYTIATSPNPVDFIIDSINTKIINGENFKVQHGRAMDEVLGYDEYNEVFEGVGTLYGLGYKYPSELTVEYWQWLACYSNPDGEVYKIYPYSDLDCQALATSTSTPHKKNKKFTIAPNPASGTATLSFTLPPFTAATVHITNSYGQKLQEHQLPMNAETLQIDDLQPGLYFVTLFSNGQPIKTQKLLHF